MSARDWFGVVIAILGLVATGALIHEYRRGRATLSSAVGWLMVFLGTGLERGLPAVAPNLKRAADVFGTVNIAGWLILIVSWFVRRRRKAQLS
jgi:hypothetical protein